MSAYPRTLRTRPAGLTLVEIMVGMAIALIGTLVMMQMYGVAERQKRTTQSGGDAQSSGAIAMFTLDRDLGQGGYGLNDLSLLGCGATLRTGVTLAALAPVTINAAAIPAGDPHTDTLLIMAGSGNGSPEGDSIERQSSPANNLYYVSAPTSFAVEDYVIAQAATRPATCSLQLEPIQGVNVAAAPYYVAVGTGAAGMTNGRLFNLGRTPAIQAYAVRGGNLTVCDYLASDCGNAATVTDPSVWTPVSAGIVSLRAEYGRDTTTPAMDAVPDVFDQATPSTACGWARISSVRLAVVARSEQRETETVTSRAPAWADSATLPIDLSADSNWGRYRYKVFQTVVPLRNIVSLGARPGC